MTSTYSKHLGHYKALLIRGPDDPHPDEGKDFHAKQQALVQTHVDMLNYAIHHRYSYKQWQNIVNIILPKEKGNDKIHRVQIIQIYEADYSALISVMWWNLVQSLEDRNTIHQGQVGGRAVHDTNTLTFMEEKKRDQLL
eukprot:14599970-Ditylum_brightwellii.AAC.1